MRALAFPLLVILSLPAQSQPVRVSEPAPLDSRLRRVVALAGVAGGLGASALAVVFVGDVDAPQPVAVIAVAGSYAAGVALATRLAGAAYGARAPWGDSVRDALLGLPAGALAGLVVGGVAGGGFFAIQLATDTVGEYNFVPAGIAILLGVPTAVWVSARVASRSLRVAPAALAAPTGERSVGLSLRVGL